ncbi:MAG: hypothetical protein D6705_00485 [Deltaproteobacteria bacterium]|nr:MAG: hypothetical protein D6705_00485 [Deltaproteobacteria bacterium]
MAAIASADPVPTDDPAVGAVLERLIEAERERLAGALELVVEHVAAQGPVERRDGRLTVAGRPLEDQQGQLSRLSRQIGCGVTLYAGNRCVLSLPGDDDGTVLAPGAFAPAVLVDEVLRQGGSFSGTIDHTARAATVSAARPLRLSTGGDVIVGIVEVHRGIDRLRRLAEMLTAGVRTHAPEARLGDQTLSDLRRLLDDLSQRLQLLALNGNILAAQAGEHGKAFRLVFRELGALAERTAQMRRILPGDRAISSKFKLSQ